MSGRVVPFIFLLIGLVYLGCAKQPVEKVKAPAPSPPASAPASVATTPAPQAPTPQVTMPVTPKPAITPAPPPTLQPLAPKEFAATDALKDIHFDFDKYNIRPGDAKILEENAGWMKANPTQLILIEGHADDRGTNEYNLALGERRAKSTMNYLATLGILPKRFTNISYGEERPLCTEKNEKCWSKNRHAHFLVKPQ